MNRALLTLALVVAPLVPSPALANEPDDPQVRKVAETYLKALTGEGDEHGKDLLLGGTTINAQLFNLDNWKIVSRDPVMREERDLVQARKLQKALDDSGHKALSQLVATAEAADGMTMTEISREEASKLLEPTRKMAAKFTQAHPVLAFVMRVDKEVYWHPKNPMRPVLDQAGKTTGKYSLEVHRYHVVSREGPRQEAREWPLRVVRFRTAKMDTGWRVLPASDWNAE